MTILDNMRRKNANQQKLEPQVPRASNLAASSVTPIYDDEVLRRYQKDIEREKMLLQLQEQCETWRHKALGIEEDNRRLEMRLDRDEQAHVVEIAKLTDARDAKVDELTQQRDQYRLTLARFETKAVMIGEALLKLANSTSEMVSKLLDEIRAEHGRPDVAGIAALAAVAEAVAAEDPPAPKIEGGTK